jgi:hypothetical protein
MDAEPGFQGGLRQASRITSLAGPLQPMHQDQIGLRLGRPLGMYQNLYTGFGFKESRGYGETPLV